MVINMLVTLAAAVTLATAAAAAPVPDIDWRSARAQLLHYDIDTDNMPNSYNFSYATGDGTSRSEQGAQGAGEAGEAGSADSAAALRVRGTTRWVTDTGAVYEMSYKAGTRGYRTVIRQIA